jgi:predicted MFS family arabinose efflux permease
MSDDYFKTSRRTNLTAFVTGEMLRGAGWAALFLIVIGFALWAIYGLGLLLPAESRETLDPNASLEQPLVPQSVMQA